MNSAFLILAGCAALAVLASLFTGIFVMTKGNKTSRKHSNRMMQARVILQGTAVLLFILAMLTGKN